MDKSLEDLEKRILDIEEDMKNIKKDIPRFHTWIKELFFLHRNKNKSIGND